MTREEAIEIMQINRDGVANMSWSEDRTKTLAALDMAIKALEQEPCDYAISHEAVMKIVDEEWLCNADYDFRSLVESLEKLPPVNPQEPQSGYWQKHTDASGNSWHACPACGHIAYTLTRFCPDCGTRLETPS